MIEKLAYNEQTVAKMIGVTVKKLRDWRDDVAVLPFVTVGRGKAIYRVGDVHELLAKKGTQAFDDAVNYKAKCPRRSYRSIAARALGRPLKTNEVVHHINGDKKDNRNCNLLICTDSYHRWLHWRMSLAFQSKLLPSPLSYTDRR